MRPIKGEEIQPLLLEILKSFRKYCDRKGIQFMLCGGTTLGAVRHQGFIPWDDDIDLYVDGENFEKLKVCAAEDSWTDESHRYQILLPAKLPNYYPFFKVIDTKTIVYEKNIAKKYATGLWVDVFHLSWWPDGTENVRKEIRKQNRYKTCNKIVIGGNYRNRIYKLEEPFAWVIRKIFLLLGKNSEYWCRKILDMDCRTSGEYVGNVCWPAGMHDRYKAKWFKKKTKLIFEGDTYPAPADYDQVLTAFYGDYMTLPPPEKRVRHNPEAYYRD